MKGRGWGREVVKGGGGGVGGNRGLGRSSSRRLDH